MQYASVVTPDKQLLRKRALVRSSQSRRASGEGRGRVRLHRLADLSAGTLSPRGSRAPLTLPLSRLPPPRAPLPSASRPQQAYGNDGKGPQQYGYGGYPQQQGGAAQGYYGPPQGAPYGGQQPYGQAPPMIVQQRPSGGGGGGSGCCLGCCAALAACCCLDAIF
ncbi:hypothetical protein DMC30DRAFT_248561 [Rhodotorula diobovata]|uniref:Cysteine-rich transmembrane CYSTM domain-containing protein n=1 Tax=Rhodotorula diobovata TaxID=5288 RepID=A0A5C5FX21_9BASI|nr:hypothetical protein DMC30DRAFT_248561 [Rhodotorula diobovata]